MGEYGYNGKTVDKKINGKVCYKSYSECTAEGEEGELVINLPLLTIQQFLFIAKIHYIAFGRECSLDVFVLVAQLNYNIDDPSPGS